MSWPDDTTTEIRYDAGNYAETYDNWSLGVNEKGHQHLISLAHLIIEHGRVKNDSLFLSIAGGTGAIEQYVQCDDKIIFDISIKMLREAKKKGVQNLVKGNFFTLPFKSETFDCVYLRSAMFHLNEDIRLATVKEMKRVAKISGRIIVVYPNIRWKRIVGLVKYHNLNYDTFGTKSSYIKSAFIKNGVKIEKLFVIYSYSLPSLNRSKFGKEIEKLLSALHLDFLGSQIFCVGVKEER